LIPYRQICPLIVRLTLGTIDSGNVTSLSNSDGTDAGRRHCPVGAPGYCWNRPASLRRRSSALVINLAGAATTTGAGMRGDGHCDGRDVRRIGQVDEGSAKIMCLL
jgi:hypothetical protein